MRYVELLVRELFFGIGTGKRKPGPLKSRIHRKFLPECKGLWNNLFRKTSQECHRESFTDEVFLSIRAPHRVKEVVSGLQVPYTTTMQFSQPMSVGRRISAFGSSHHTPSTTKRYSCSPGSSMSAQVHMPSPPSIKASAVGLQRVETTSDEYLGSAGSLELERGLLLHRLRRWFTRDLWRGYFTDHLGIATLPRRLHFCAFFGHGTPPYPVSRAL